MLAMKASNGSLARMLLNGLWNGTKNVIESLVNDNNSTQHDSFFSGIADGIISQGIEEIIVACEEKISENNKSFKELESRTVEVSGDILNKERIEFITDECMKPNTSDADPKLHKISDFSETFIAKAELLEPISINEAKARGFILPKKVEKPAKDNPNLKIKPLMIRCYGVTSGDTLTQIATAKDILLNKIPKQIEEANTLILDYIKKISEENDGPQTLIVPFITGHSLGGVFASVIAIKNNIGSVVFNPLGLNKAIYKYIGDKAWEEANEHGDKHLIISVDGDFTSSTDSIIPLKNFFNTKVPGQTITIPAGKIESFTEKHCEYREAFKQALGEHTV